MTTDPRHIGEIQHESINTSDSPFAQGFHEFLASTEGAPDSGGDAVETTGPYKNTMLCVDVKTILILDRIMKLGKKYVGYLMLDKEDHLRFEEFRKRITTVKRNERVYDGNHITMTLRLEDGHVRLNFKEISFAQDFNIDGYAIEVMQEIRIALYCLVEKKAITE